MRIPLDSALLGVHGFIRRHPYFRQIGIPLFVTGCMVVVALAKYTPRLDDLLRSHFLLITLPLLGSSLIPIVVTWLYEAGEAVRGESSPSEKELSLLLAVIEEVVQAKSVRFEEFATTVVQAKAAGSPPAKGCAFETITQPDGQIKLLVQNLRQFFLRLIGESPEVLVELVKMGEVYVESLVIRSPNPTGLVDYAPFQREDCGFSRAKERDNLVIVEDIEEELKKPAETRCYCPASGSLGEGSMLVYPIRNHPSGYYCLSVTVSIPRYFKRSREGFYRRVVSPIVTRLKLELNLREIREGTR
ncbi:MAG: hypothetical protein GHCLOJNM_03581 [bacterium]|nr:hypothetical protein [bacterium]